MTRRRFAFWIGMGLFGVADRVGASELDGLAAALMEATEPDALPPTPTPAEPLAAAEMPVHWQTTHNRTWRWVQREHYADGQWRLTGMTTPVRRDTGAQLADAAGYLPEDAVPSAYRAAYDGLFDANEESLTPVNDHGVAADSDTPGPDAAEHRRSRHGRPPSRWLRTLTAAELSVWLATIEPPEAGVNGLSFEEHLTRDHGFDAERIAGLDEAELAKLHAAAHHGY